VNVWIYSTLNENFKIEFRTELVKNGEVHKLESGGASFQLGTLNARLDEEVIKDWLHDDGSLNYQVKIILSDPTYKESLWNKYGSRSRYTGE